MSIRSIRRPSLPAAILVLAAVIGFVGYGLIYMRPVGATTGSVVNIADPNTATNLAKVNRAGALSIAGTVSAIPATPSVPLNLATAASNKNNGEEGGELISPTQARISLTSLTVALTNADDVDPWQVALAIMTVPNGTTAGHCLSAETASTVIQVFALHPGTTATLSPATPIAFQPPAGQTRCLLVEAFNDGGTASNDFGLAYVAATGFVVSGTYSGAHNTNLPLRTPRP